MNKAATEITNHRGGRFVSNSQPKKTMSNYYATARSNYFAVKDEKAFREWAARTGLAVLEPDHHDKTSGGVRRLGVASGDSNDSGGWPNSFWNDDLGDYEEIDVSGQLAEHLADGEVAVLMEAGSESLRYVTGSAVAVNNRGETVEVHLESIYEAARHLGGTITRAEY